MADNERPRTVRTNGMDRDPMLHLIRQPDLPGFIDGKWHMKWTSLQANLVAQSRFLTSAEIGNFLGKKAPTVESNMHAARSFFLSITREPVKNPFMFKMICEGKIIDVEPPPLIKWGSGNLPRSEDGALQVAGFLAHDELDHRLNKREREAQNNLREAAKNPGEYDIDSLRGNLINKEQLAILQEFWNLGTDVDALYDKFREQYDRVKFGHMFGHIKRLFGAKTSHHLLVAAYQMGYVGGRAD